MRKDDNTATENDDSFCRTEAICQGVAQEGTGGPSKETLYECNRRYETMYYIYIGLQHVKCELVRS